MRESVKMALKEEVYSVTYIDMCSFDVRWSNKVIPSVWVLKSVYAYFIPQSSSILSHPVIRTRAQHGVRRKEIV